jgi:hypothetical protein
VLRTRLEHTFHLSGGPKGKALCTSEVVQIGSQEELLDENELDEAENLNEEIKVS